MAHGNWLLDCFSPSTLPAHSQPYRVQRRINLTEQGLRMIAGVAMIIRSGHSKMLVLFEVGGPLFERVLKGR